ncbi:polyadenylate-binding protein [Phaffia rhodozyma]|uniref:Polyadenylate-binding protein n=1 Tax=Phaffia rhodozyma TaxID=264483 RepID=A0A0F7ST56_PHARH|nr:polyadenylate-binding protein [Phaffia rhodozyma]
MSAGLINLASRLAVPAIFGAAIVQSSIYDVPGGYRAVMFDRFSGVKNEATGEGTHFMIPWLQRAILYDVRIKPRNINTTTGSKDLQMVSITLRILSRPDVDHLPKIYQNLGQDYDERVLPSIGNEVLKAIVAQHNAAELIEERELVSARIRADLLKRAAEFNIKLEDVSITHMTFGKEFTTAVEQKQIAQQDAERAKFIVEMAEHERQAGVIRAEGEAEAATTIGRSLDKAGAAFVNLRRIETAREVATTLASSRNVTYLPSSNGNIEKALDLSLLSQAVTLFLDIFPTLSDRFLPSQWTPSSSNSPSPLSTPTPLLTSRERLPRAHLYVGNLSPRVTEYMLTEIFAVAGPVQNVKIIPDRNYQHGGLNYGFVEYMDMRAAETALQTLNGRKIFDTEIKVNWAYQGQQNKEDTQGHFHVFVGDLSPEVNDEILNKAFGAFGTLSDARVMWDMSSGKSRGYGFLAFRDKTDAEQAIATMNGEWLGSRAIRVNWANQKTQTGGQAGAGGQNQQPRMGGAGGAPAPINFQGGPLSYEVVVGQTPAFNTTVYVGNLIPYTTQADLIPLFQGYGYIVEIRMQADRGFAFVKLDSHENAAMAIVQLQGQLVHGRPVKCSWGKDRMPGEGGAQPGAGAMGGQPGGGIPQYGMQPPQMYGMPPNAYGQYPFAGYPAYGQQPGAPAAGAIPGQGEQAQDPATLAAQQAYYQQALAAQSMQAPAAAGGAQSGWGDFYNQAGAAPQN